MARRHEHSVDWKHLVVPGIALLAVVLIGAVAIWSFLEQQLLVTQPDPLPKVTVVTSDPHSRLAAGWVRLLGAAELNPTLVPLDTFDPIEGVVVFCDIPQIPARLVPLLDQFVRRGGSLAFVGMPPQTAIGKFRLIAESGMSDPTMKFGENASPLLARLNPGWTVNGRASRVAFLEETPHMGVDVRWAVSSRAVVMHIEQDGARYIWFGLDPDATPPDNELLVLLRTAFRWVAGQPISEGAVGTPDAAKTLTPEARRAALRDGFTFRVDRTQNPNVLAVRMANNGPAPLSNPTVKVWLPPRVTTAALGGDVIMRRNASLTGQSQEGACMVSLPSLGRNGERVLKLTIAARQARSSGSAPSASPRS